MATSNFESKSTTFGFNLNKTSAIAEDKCDTKRVDFANSDKGSINGDCKIEEKSCEIFTEQSEEESILIDEKDSEK